MKSISTGYSVITLFIVFVCPIITISDPFMGEGKQAYIERYVSKSEIPGLQMWKRKSSASILLIRRSNEIKAN